VPNLEVNMKNKTSILVGTRHFFYALVAVIFCGCESTSYDKQPTIYSNGEMSDLKIYVIDSCEYVGKLRGYQSDVLTHKGNCKFCAERIKK
jgi:hypothetical protein